MVNSKRQDVLTEQLDAIDQNYEKEKRDLSTNFGLLHGKRKYLDYKVYPHTGDPENKALILVFFSDRILNLKAEELEMNVLIQNRYQTLPFITEGQNNFQRFNASQKIALFKKIFDMEFDIEVLKQAEVIGVHFMLHTSEKKAI